LLIEKETSIILGISKENPELPHFLMKVQVFPSVSYINEGENYLENS
jgi:hypothetical protein